MSDSINISKYSDLFEYGIIITEMGPGNEWYLNG
ncbi:hypothetical protein C7475_105162 [Chitinophaga sp. S165]|nr:hypothetical protein C7475_105162 [Chitinophaga sp. S165]